jgi:hypothetical protein
VWQTLLKYEPLFQLIHITDQNTDRILCVHTPHAFALAIALVIDLLFRLLFHFNSGSEGTPKVVARFRFSLPPMEQMAELTKLLEMSLFLIDHVATNVRLNQQVPRTLCEICYILYMLRKL